MNKSNLIPKNKEDVEFIKELELQSIEKVKEVIEELLEWMQDGNWPQASLIANYLKPHLNYFEKEIINVLNTNDDMWKYWIMKSLVLNSNEMPSKKILDKISQICYNPTQDEKESEVDIVAYEILNKYTSLPRSSKSEP
ncbi:DUF5071 domain-containing protein [Flavobacterium columnare]|uniref:DUF5071 domain-containing protein n=2 Tax=Flavobacterium columnare TaxID=996 RepID=G8X4W3_FLACA|nr:DUF5071 domain-containing protein [Flavobacterium columnare]AEW86779.1 hypothetical protein FCOL_09850 [Flavobacterium columnare ATCC 49512]MBF6652489.1 DUF5071 domain-containing protein [Flavobacterium columnare]